MTRTKAEGRSCLGRKSSVGCVASGILCDNTVSKDIATDVYGECSFFFLELTVADHKNVTCRLLKHPSIASLIQRFSVKSVALINL